MALKGILALILWASVAMAEQYHIMVVGHRGCAGLLPENTLEGFKHAFEMGVDAVEFDVHLTKDGIVIVNHDFRLNTALTKNAGGDWIDSPGEPICERSYDALLAYRVGHVKADTPYRESHPLTRDIALTQLPTLEDVFKLAKAYPNVMLQVEIKTHPIDTAISSDYKKLTRGVLDLIDKYHYENRVGIVAFDWRVHQYLKQTHPKLATFFCFISQYDDKSRVFDPKWFGDVNLSDYKNSVPFMAASLGASHWSVFHKELTAEMVAEAHVYGLKVNAWTPNTQAEMAKLIGYGVDAITTDRPDLLLELLSVGRSAKSE